MIFVDPQFDGRVQHYPKGLYKVQALKIVLHSPIELLDYFTKMHLGDAFTTFVWYFQVFTSLGKKRFETLWAKGSKCW